MNELDDIVLDFIGMVPRNSKSKTIGEILRNKNEFLRLVKKLLSKIILDDARLYFQYRVSTRRLVVRSSMKQMNSMKSFCTSERWKIILWKS